MSKNKNTQANSFNAINWFELPTGNMSRAVEFYQTTLGVTLKQESFGGLPHAIFPSQCPDGAMSTSGALVALQCAKFATCAPKICVKQLECRGRFGISRWSCRRSDLLNGKDFALRLRYLCIEAFRVTRDRRRLSI